MSWRFVAALVALVVCSACGSGNSLARGLSRARVDSLPGGGVMVTNDGPTEWVDTVGWRLVPERIIGPQLGDSSMFEDPNALAVDRAGTLYVMERRRPRVHVVTGDGHYLRTLGRQGAGPGEFQSMVVSIRSDTLFVHDPRQARTSLLTTDGTVLLAWPSLCCNYSRIMADRRGRISIPGEVGRTEDASRQGIFGAFGWVRYGPTGIPVDTLYGPADLPNKVWEYFEGPQHNVAIVPLLPGRVRVLTPDGDLLTGTSDDYRLWQTSTGRDTVRIIVRQSKPVPVPDSLRRALLQTAIQRTPALATIAQLSDIPTTFPRFGIPRIDPTGNLWVPVPSGEVAAGRFDVFDADGKFRGEAANPVPNAAFWLFTADRAIAIDPEGERGPVVRLFRIDRPRQR